MIMTQRKSMSTGRGGKMRSGTLIITLFILVFLVMLNIIGLAVIFYMRRKMSQASGWPSTNGVVTASSVEARSSGEDEGFTDYPVVRYSYQVGGQAFQGNRIALGPETGGSGARKTVARYATGAPVTVFYNPQNPAEAILEKKAPAQALIWIILGLFDCVICAAIPLVWWAIPNP
jgi:hypothetical protein